MAIDVLRINLERALRGDPLPAFQSSEYAQLMLCIRVALVDIEASTKHPSQQARLALTCLGFLTQALRASTQAERALALSRQDGQLPC